MLNKAWNDPVWSKVIASTIVGVGLLGLTYLANLWHWPFTPLKEAKSISDSEGHKELREYNANVLKPTEQSVPNTKQPISGSPSIKQFEKEKESGTRSQAIPSVMPPTHVETKQPVAEHPCEQSIVGLNRPPEEFRPEWRSLLTSFRKQRDTHDLESLFKFRGRIPSGSTGKDLIREASYTLNCLEEEGELRMEKLGKAGRYWGEDFENQKIIFNNP